MGLEENVQLLRSTGGECLVCDVKIQPQEVVMEINFKIPLFLTSATVRREAHLHCAEDLDRVIRTRLVQAGYRGRRPV